MPKSRRNRFYYRDGSIHTEIRELEGKLHSLSRKWHFNGKLAEEQYYQHGLMHGLSRQWDTGGRVLGSFEMNHGTGTQRYWHENGQPKLEMDCLNGKFHGRLRMWLRDGTLVQETYYIHGADVSRATYLKEARKNSDWPQYRGEPVGKIALPNLDLKRKEYRLFLESVFEKPHAEARQWLRGETKTRRRSLPIFRSANTALRFVEQLYKAGAHSVEVAPIYSGQAGKLFADCLLIQLPEVKIQRKKLRAICSNYCGRRLAAMLPDNDFGESHLFLRLY